MPSEADSLKVLTYVSYLTETSGSWRPADWTAMKMVKALKGDAINGYFELRINGKTQRFDQTNISKFVDRVPLAMLRQILEEYDDKAILVPIPNSHVTVPNAQNFKTLDLAKAIAKHSDGKFIAVPALVFKQPQVSSRKGGPRSPYHFKSAYRVTEKIEGPIILIDDVCTTGGHLIGAAWKLNNANRDVILACAFGSSTKEQVEKPINKTSQILSLADPLADFL